MPWSSLDSWIVIVAALAAIACALLGNFLLLRRLSMMGDAISHAVLPGIALAFIWTGSRASLVMFIGAAVVGVITALFSQWLHSLGKVDQGAAMGVVFTTLFAIGLLLMVRGADKVDLDPGCVLYGALEFTPLHTLTCWGMEVPRAAVIIGAVLLLNLSFVLLFFKELRLSAFDPALATTLGFSANLMHYLLMALVAITTVAVFEAVGSILVIAMLIVPPAVAYLLTQRLSLMILLSVIVAGVAAVFGHMLALYLPAVFHAGSINSAGMMAVAAGLLLLLAVLFSPQQGIIRKLLTWARSETSS